MDGLIILDKPAGLRPARAVDLVKRLLPRRVRVGHGGSLDPFATGMLIILVGRATRQFDTIASWRKTYHATARLGAVTMSDDSDTPEQQHVDRVVSMDEVTTALKRFVGIIEQRPSTFSALKINGDRACDLARAGKVPALQPRPVEIYNLTLIDYAWPFLRMEVECGRGTYIRAIARDLGAQLGVGGYLTQLRRTRIGPFGIEEAVRPEMLTSESLSEKMIPLHGLHLLQLLAANTSTPPAKQL
jgi:tRNA pseudouridine55 synthase